MKTILSQNEWQAASKELLDRGMHYEKKARRAIGWAIFFALVGLLLVAGVVVVELPLMNGAAIYDINDQLVPILLLCGAVMNFIALIAAAVGKKRYNRAVQAFYKRSELPPVETVAPLFVKMI